MRKFRITVNGKSYDVDVEEIQTIEPKRVDQENIKRTQTAPIPVSKPPAPMAKKGEPPKKKEVIKDTEPQISEGTAITAPMPGVILDMKVSNNQEVAEGETLLVLEAMKMENEISSPITGKVAKIKVKKGDSVNAGDLLITIV